ncbi:hypothetical protein AA0117_g10238 [Alternaria alternata]|uniref:Uncharacterized protein n=1 Tax=Alternaria alternata TaxID=5599 RepID=A0A4Q4N7C1_ALTAL|nr:hypothetical protein AA0117_g10238 [Alternaria alternata]
MASDAHLTYRLSSFGKKRDVLSVLRDSYMQVTKTGKKAFNLPSNVKAYGDPTDFTADADINLLAQINIHFSVVEPSLKAGGSDHVYDNLMQLDALPGSLAYSTDRKAGGDVFDIHYIHMVDYVHEVPVKVQIQQPAMKILRADGEANKIVKSGVPVLLIVHGTLPINKGVVVPEVKFYGFISP